MRRTCAPFTWRRHCLHPHRCPLPTTDRPSLTRPTAHVPDRLSLWTAIGNLNTVYNGMLEQLRKGYKPEAVKNGVFGASMDVGSGFGIVRVKYLWATRL